MHKWDKPPPTFVNQIVELKPKTGLDIMELDYPELIDGKKVVQARSEFERAISHCVHLLARFNYNKEFFTFVNISYKRHLRQEQKIDAFKVLSEGITPNNLRQKVQSILQASCCTPEHIPASELEDFLMNP